MADDRDRIAFLIHIPALFAASADGPVNAADEEIN